LKSTLEASWLRRKLNVLDGFNALRTRVHLAWEEKKGTDHSVHVERLISNQVVRVGEKEVRLFFLRRGAFWYIE